MAARRSQSEPIECLFTNGLWVPGRILTIGSIDKDEYFRVRKGLIVLSQSPEPITIILNSDGGNALDGMGIFDSISDLDNHVIIRVEGEASSMGAVILQAADFRTMTKHAVLMLHDGSDGFSDGTCRDFERRASECKRAREEMYEIFAKRSGRSVAHFRKMLAHDWYVTADKAIKEGLVDDVVS